MSAERDKNPPDDWADKVTDAENENGDIGKTFTVRDKRHWVEGVDEDEEKDLTHDKPTYVKALEDELNKKDETLREYIAQYKAAKSNMNEAIGRIEREKSREVNFRIAELARTFLSILDDLRAAVDAAKSNDDVGGVVEGLDLITQRIYKSLEELGISEIDAKDKKHDPNFHDAIGVEEFDDPEMDGVVVEEVKKGYVLGDVLVRPATVVVGKSR